MTFSRNNKANSSQRDASNDLGGPLPLQETSALGTEVTPVIEPGSRARAISGLWIPPLILIAVALIGLLVKNMDFARTEIHVSIWLSQHQLPGISHLAFAIAVVFSSTVATVIAVVTAIGIGVIYTIRRALSFLWLTVISWGGAAVIKPIVLRPRPQADLLYDPISPKTGVLSYPSGHTAFATALFLAIVFTLVSRKHRKLGLALAGVGILLVAASRVYVGAHFMTDVAAGATSAAASCWFALTLLTRRLRPHTERHRALPASNLDNQT
ncbi:MAG: phosphatase PAP2 family protein [Actinomycetaceae bacterium]|nr:phosphatase PAP2 family protein [Actinomycetaceae bacterium]